MADPIIGKISVGDGATFTPSINGDVLSWSNNKNLPNPENLDIVGATFTPAVSNAGVLSWSNNKGLPNPQSVDMAQAVVDKKPGWGIPIGYEYFTFNPNIPQGSLPLFGGEYSRTTYSDLWAWVQTQTGYLKTEAEWQDLATANNGNVPYYSNGDGSTTFRVPSLKCWVRGANGTVTEVGSYYSAGLPNITGAVELGTIGYIVPVRDANGAFSGTTLATFNTANSSGGSVTANAYADFDASRSSSVYGNSTTVQPESIVGMWLVKAYGVIQDTGTINEQQYIDDRFTAAKDYTDSEIAAGVPTGCVQAFAGNNTPAGWLLCDGAAVSRITYAALFSVIGTSYGDGDGLTTFNVPNLIDKFVEGSATAGTEKSAGLPNIKGEIGFRAFEADNLITMNGLTPKAFTFDSNNGATFGWKIARKQNSDNQKCDTLYFDANSSNSIYSDNVTTVQPPAVTMRYIIKY